MYTKEIESLLDALVTNVQQGKEVDEIKKRIVHLSSQRVPMTEEQAQKHIKRIRESALRDNRLTEEDLRSAYLDGMFGRGKMTNSRRAIKVAEIAYHRGMMRGVSFVQQGESPITLSW